MFSTCPLQSQKHIATSLNQLMRILQQRPIQCILNMDIKSWKERGQPGRHPACHCGSTVGRRAAVVFHHPCRWRSHTRVLVDTHWASRSIARFAAYRLEIQIWGMAREVHQFVSPSTSLTLSNCSV